jgi:hypothetical protein
MMIYDWMQRLWLLPRAGAPLSAMDGVLVAVKDEIDCLPYPTTGKLANLSTRHTVSSGS